MKIKDLVAMLQQLDQERNIWILYDLFAFMEPNVIKEATKEECWDEKDKDKIGDYYIEAW